VLLERGRQRRCARLTCGRTGVCGCASVAPHLLRDGRELLVRVRGEHVRRGHVRTHGCTRALEGGEAPLVLASPQQPPPPTPPSSTGRLGRQATQTAAAPASTTSEWVRAGGSRGRAESTLGGPRGGGARGGGAPRGAEGDEAGAPERLRLGEERGTGGALRPADDGGKRQPPWRQQQGLRSCLGWGRRLW